MPTVGYATLQVIPSVQGIGGQIREQLTGPVAAAGDEAGDGFGKRLAKGLAVGVAAAAAGGAALLVKGFGDVLQQGQLTGEVRAALGATPAQAAQYGKAAGQLYSGTMASSFEQGTEAIKAIVSAGLVPTGATNAQLKEIGTGVLDLGRAFKVDLGETATAAGQLIRNGMAKDAKEALDLVTVGLRGADERGQDVLETFNEYSPIFKTAGLDGATALGLIRQGLAGGAKETDKIGDAVKEFTLRVTGGGASIDQAFKDAGLSSKQLTADVAAGGPRATAALGSVLDALRQMPATAERAQVIQNLFGGPGEDLGAAIFSLNVHTAASSLGTLAGAADATGTALRDNAGAKITAFTRGLQQGLTNAVGSYVLPALTSAASFLSDKFGPAVGQAADWVRGHAVPALGDLAHHLADKVVPALTTGATWLSEHLAPAAADVAHWLRDDLLPAATTIAAKLSGEFGPAASDIARILRDDIGPAALAVAGWLGHDFAPAAADVAVWLGGHLVPAVADTAAWLTGTLVPALGDTVHWLGENKVAVMIVAGIITAALLPVLITAAVGYAQAGIAATVSAAQQVASWVTTGTTAVGLGALSVASSYRTVAGWVAAGASAVVGAAQQVGAWVATGAAAVASGATQAATWVATGARAVVGAALQVGAGAAVVGGWILMGVQSLLQAARMAAAWLIALGPVGWVIAAVVALVALIVANWDTIVAATSAAWDWIWGKVKEAANFIWQLFLNWSLPGLLIKHWSSIRDGAVAGWNALVDWIKQVPGWLYSAFMNFTLIGLLISHWSSIKQGAINGFTATIDWIRGVPGMITGALGNLGSLLVSAGGDVVRGLWSGISGMGGWLKDKLIGFALAAIPEPIRKALDIHSPSRVMAREVGRWIPAGIVEGVEDAAPQLDATMRALVQPPAVPRWMTPDAGAIRPAGTSALATLPAFTGGAAGGITVPVSYNAPTPEDPQKAAMEIGRRVAVAVSV